MSGNRDNPFAAPQPFRPYPPPVLPRPPLNRLAVAALLLGLLGLAPAALPLGFVALRQLARRRQRGRLAAWLGIGLSLLWMGGLVAAVGWAVTHVGPGRDAAGAVVRSGRALPNDVRVGDCVEQLGPDGLGAGERVGPLVLVPCGGPNGGQVFARFDLPASGWPGEQAVQRGAEQGCADRYRATGRQDVASEIRFLYPSGRNWWRLGDRRVVCLAVPQRLR